MQTIETHLGTHGSYKALIASGFKEEQAEGIIEVMHNTGADYATKADLRETGLRLREDMQKMETRLTKLIYVNTFTIIGVVSALVSIATAIIKFL